MRTPWKPSTTEPKFPSQLAGREDSKRNILRRGLRVGDEFSPVYLEQEVLPETDEPNEGIQVYNPATKTVYVWDGTSFVPVGGATASPHALGGAAHNADTLANVNAKISDADAVALAGQIGGTAASPDVRGLRETAGPTLLTVGAVADGEYIKRSGATAIGGTPAGTGDQAWQRFRMATRAHTEMWGNVAGASGLAAGRIYAIPIYVPDSRAISNLSFEVAASVAGSSARMGLYSDSGCYPGALLQETAAISTASNGRKVGAITTVSAGPNQLLWVALLISASISVQFVTAMANLQRFRGFATTGVFTSPTSFLIAIQAYGNMPNPFTAGASEQSVANTLILAVHYD